MDSDLAPEISDGDFEAAYARTKQWFLRRFPDFQSFRNHAGYAQAEGNYKDELVSLYNETVRPALQSGENERVGAAALKTLTTPLPGNDGKPQNIVSWRYIDLIRKLEGSSLAVFGSSLSELIDEDRDMNLRIAEFNQRLSQFGGGKTNAAATRSLGSFFLTLARPDRYFFLKTRELERAFREFDPAFSWSPDGLTGTEVLWSSDLGLRIFNRLIVEGWNPKDFIDVQGFLWTANYARDMKDAGNISPTQAMKGSLLVNQAPTNLILYGPPGTGKTYWMQQKFAAYTDNATSVDEETWLLEVVSDCRWRPLIAATLASIGKPVRVTELNAHHWIQAKRRQRGVQNSIQPTLWAFLQEHTPESVATVNNKIRRAPFIFDKNESGDWHLQPDWAELDEDAAELLRRLQTGPGEDSEPVRRYKVLTFHPSFSYEDFIRGIRPVAANEDGITQFQLVDGKFKQICDEARANRNCRYALFIDEINRANIAKVFGELITLIEPDKRAVYDDAGNLLSGMEIQLPGGDESDVNEKPFGVPSNLDIYGTMNTADRSIALLDIALRRRFQFEEREPDYSVLGNVEKIDLGALLCQINDRLEYLLDRDHRIGHGYLIKVGSLDELRSVFKQQIIPLLQEYFFDDFARVRMVLMNPGAPPFVQEQRLEPAMLFPGATMDGALEARTRYLLTHEQTWSEPSFRAIYSSIRSVPEEALPS